MDDRVGQFFASGLCAMLAFAIVWPFETLKNLHQSGNVSHKRATGVLIQVRSLGLRNLYVGILPGLLSVGMRNSAAMLVMQAAQDLMR